ncbi:MAG: hypothetical protein U5O16_24410 [Rhodococcus sp. (in: high G+C Gram-positive bacteria)]|uniref:hypothetical protein n=1 Tax=Rhodococcus sp. TaxID=1831 RepID=UPI002ADA52E2|nr:hypothetical protein [Rhodococcus sp. (in: high G+C Gram-positive bacteria)]
MASIHTTMAHACTIRPAIAIVPAVNVRDKRGSNVVEIRVPTPRAAKNNPSSPPFSSTPYRWTAVTTRSPVMMPPTTLFPVPMRVSSRTSG